MGHWELGSRLLRFKQTGDWRKVTEGGPYGSWTEYLSKGLSVSMPQAKVYLRAAELPLQVTLRYGISGASLLAAMVELTPEDETVEQAMELVVDGDDGKPKRFADMTEPERERALARMRELSDVKVHGANGPTAERVVANEFRDRVREAAGSLLTAEQVQAKVIGGNPMIELKGIAVERVAEVFEALANGLK
jgi:hypothetical protein